MEIENVRKKWREKEWESKIERMENSYTEKLVEGCPIKYEADLS